MNIARGLVGIALVIGLTSLGLGLLAALTAGVIAGDWYLVREPWVTVAFTLIAIGLAMTGLFALAQVALQPLGWLRLLAVPPAVVIGLWWAFILFEGVPTSGFGGSQRDIRSVLYSNPILLAISVLLTLLVASPLAFASIRRRTKSVT